MVIQLSREHRRSWVFGFGFAPDNLLAWLSGQVMPL
jgi:hypothetical protein